MEGVPAGSRPGSLEGARAGSLAAARAGSPSPAERANGQSPDLNLNLETATLDPPPAQPRPYTHMVFRMVGRESRPLISKCTVT